MRALIAGATIAALAGIAAADVANFDSETEGFKGASFTSGGITFFGVNSVAGLNPDGSNFVPGEYGTDLIVERAITLFNDFPSVVSSPNVLGFGSAFVPGDNLSINIFSTVSMTTGSVQNAASLDLLYFENGPWGSIDIHFDALLGGSVVGSDGLTISDLGGRDNLTSVHLSIDGVNFDELRLYAQFGNGTNTVIAGIVDNVSITPAPGTAALLALGGLVSVRRRR
ncbi:MAG: MYXO-CTERM sorting domain-containing protein [Phycisphaerales bacterium]